MTSIVDAVAKNVAEHGWAVVNVEKAADLPAYSYSVGLFKTHSHPELIVFGLEASTLQQIINTIGAAIRAGRSFAQANTADNIIRGFECAFRPVSEAAETALMGQVITYYGAAVPAIHCIWPDQDGRFPWDPGASADYRRLHPVLSEGLEENTSAIRPGEILS